jgi:hypothetical protein
MLRDQALHLYKNIHIYKIIFLLLLVVKRASVRCKLGTSNAVLLTERRGKRVAAALKREVW